METLQGRRKLHLDMLKEHAKERPNDVYLRQPIDRKYHTYTWAEAYDYALKLASALKALSLDPGDKVAILSKNCAHWFFADFAISLAGFISVPIYPTAGNNTIEYILEHSQATMLIVGKLDDDSALKKAMEQNAISLNVTTISMPYHTIPCDYSMEYLVSRHSPLTEINQPEQNDVFSLTYTSGSTGNPKGAVIRYRNMAYAAGSTVAQSEQTKEDRLLSYLPLAHIAERTLTEHSSLYSGASVTFVESLETFSEDIQNTRPTVFFSVPRLWMKFQGGVLNKLPQKKLDTLLRIPLLNRLIKSKIQKQLGLDQARLIGSGTAPISTATLEWFRKIGLNISEGWGMTETTGAGVMHHPYNPGKIGTIGKPIEGTQIKISEEGEVLIKSAGVISEYYRASAKTAETFEDGWLRTGDMGELDSDGYLRITGRVKDIFKSGKGKYVAPVPIESLMFENRIIEQVCVMGLGLPQPIATVVLSEERKHSMSKDDISKSLEETRITVNERLESHEQIEKIAISQETWSIENGLLTPTLKIKRNTLENKYKNTFQAKSKESSVIWLEH